MRVTEFSSFARGCNTISEAVAAGVSLVMDTGSEKSGGKIYRGHLYKVSPEGYVFKLSLTGCIAQGNFYQGRVFCFYQ